MEYFETLPNNLQQMAWRQLADELVDGFAQQADSAELEERLLEALDEVITEKPQSFLDTAGEFYAKGN